MDETQNLETSNTSDISCLCFLRLVGRFPLPFPKTSRSEHIAPFTQSDDCQEKNRVRAEEKTLG